MNCCDYNCVQGRNCPVRVARVKARYPKYVEYDPPSQWRNRLRGLARWILYALLGLLLWSVALLLVVN